MGKNIELMEEDGLYLNS